VRGQVWSGGGRLPGTWLQRVASHLGYAMELGGLSFAAFGMLRSWKVNAQPGTTFWPTWLRAAYFKVARLWGHKTRPIELEVNSGVAIGSAGFVGHAVGRVVGATVNERLDSVEADVDQLREDTQNLTAQQQAHAQKLVRELASLRGEIVSAQQATERQLSAQTVTDLRPAAYGVFLAAIGLALQWYGSI
jgi:hypothetical protein